MRSPVRPSPWMRLSHIELQHVRAGRNASQQQKGAGYQVRVVAPLEHRARRKRGMQKPQNVKASGFSEIAMALDQANIGLKVTSHPDMDTKADSDHIET
jgi:hypothetical protein